MAGPVETQRDTHYEGYNRVRRAVIAAARTAAAEELGLIEQEEHSTPGEYLWGAQAARYDTDAGLMQLRIPGED